MVNQIVNSIDPTSIFQISLIKISKGKTVFIFFVENFDDAEKVYHT